MRKRAYFQNFWVAEGFAYQTGRVPRTLFVEVSEQVPGGYIVRWGEA